jgi:hypothetical protein
MRGLSSLALLTSLLITAGAILMAACESESEETDAPKTPVTPVETPPTVENHDHHPLLDRVREEGTIRVIVRLEFEALDDPDENRHAIDEAQDALLRELDDTDVDVRRRYKSLPMFALIVDEAVLRILLASPLVANVQEDEADPPAD